MRCNEKHNSNYGIVKLLEIEHWQSGGNTLTYAYVTKTDAANVPNNGKIESKPFLVLHNILKRAKVRIIYVCIMKG